METEERRRHQRLSLRLKVICHAVGTAEGRYHTGNTVNASPGGMLIEIYGANFAPGGLINIEMTVPPTQGLLEYGGKFAAHARVLRCETPRTISAMKSPRTQTLAVEFCHAPRLKV